MGELSLWVGEGRSKGVYRATRPDSAGDQSRRVQHSYSSFCVAGSCIAIQPFVNRAR